MSGALTTPTAVGGWRDGDRIDQVLLVRQVDRGRTRTGSPFLRLMLGDSSGCIPAVMWEDAVCEAGVPMRARGRVGDHGRYGRQLTVEHLEPVSPDTVSWDELVEGPVRPATELEVELDALIDSVSQAHLRTLLCRLVGDAYRAAPAAKLHHHAYRHGLLEHCVGMAQLADAAARVFPAVDRDVAIAGALLHDIGKLEAYEHRLGVADLTDAGKLEGEIPLGYYRVRREIDAIEGFPPDTARALVHVILSHHGRLEYGSPVTPSTREATVVHAVDELSGRLGAFDRLEKDLRDGEQWSRWDRVLDGQAWFPSTGGRSRSDDGDRR